MKDNKLKGKDLINIGIYAAIYCLLMTCIGYIIKKWTSMIK